jgi:hypothetical protein
MRRRWRDLPEEDRMFLIGMTWKSVAMAVTLILFLIFACSGWGK